MKIFHNEKYGIIHVTVEGGTETDLNPGFELVIKKIVESDNRRLLLDLGALKYLKSSALRVILDVIREIDRKSGKVVLCSLNLYVKEIFEGNSLKDTITIAESVESGLSSLLRPLKAA